MKVAVLLYQNMRHAPFFKFYEHILQSMNNVDYDVLYLDRHPELREPKDAHHIAIPWIGTDDHKYLLKMLTGISYAVQVRRIIALGQYDFIIVLTTMPGVLLSGFLSKHYHNKYIVDIRDYTKEHFSLYYKAEKKLVDNSALNVISSPDYSLFLPASEYHVCHNLNIEDSNSENRIFKKADNKHIVIAYIGNIQYAEYCQQLIDLVNKDDRFEFHFYGSEGGNQVVTNFVNYLHNPRIVMEGSFRPGEKPSIFARSDLIFNCYGNNNNIVKYAISNKYYDAACYRRPLLVSPDTTMARLTGKFAFSLDLQNCCNLNELYLWYCGIDNLSFDNYCKSVVDNANLENSILEATIKKLLL